VTEVRRLTEAERAELDAAARCADIVRQAIVDGHVSKWLAIRLSDGGSDGVAYDTREEAVRHQLHETQCGYVKVRLDNYPPREALSFLRWHRMAYDAGARLPDPEAPNGGPELYVPTVIEEAEQFLNRAARRKRGIR